MAIGIFLTALDATIVVSCKKVPDIVQGTNPNSSLIFSICRNWQRSQRTTKDQLDCYLIPAHSYKFPVRAAIMNDEVYN
jgi:hypothetical protein